MSQRFFSQSPLPSSSSLCESSASMTTIATPPRMSIMSFTPCPTPAVGFFPSSSHKREREFMGEEEIELSYSRNKRMVHDSFQSLSLSDEKRAKLNTSPVPDEHATMSGDELFDEDTTITEFDSTPQIQRQSSVDSDTSTHSDHGSTAESDSYASVFKGGRTQYVRKIDYLVDELIRKKHAVDARRTLTQGDLGVALPDYVGPSPRVDQRLLSLIVMPTGPAPQVSTRPAAPHKNALTAPHIDKDKAHGGFSGEKTHSDWDMEEVSLSQTPRVNNMFALTTRPSQPSDESESESDACDSDTDMACCDDQSLSASSITTCTTLMGHASGSSMMDQED